MTERTHSNTSESATDRVGAVPNSGLDIASNKSSPEIVRSLNPEEVRIRTAHVRVDQISQQIGNGEIYWDSEVQRAFAWQPEQQSQFIESLLLRIPIPAFYAAADENHSWSVVDGVQRLSSVFNYVTDEFPLNRLEYFIRFNGKRYNDLPRPIQRRIDETQLVLHIVETGTPEDVRLNIWQRINPRRFDAEEATNP